MISNQFWLFNIPTHFIVVCKFLCVLCTMLLFTFLTCRFVKLGFLFSLQVNDYFGLSMMYHSKYFHVMFCI
jgi:hypothetical protein